MVRLYPELKMRIILILIFSAFLTFHCSEKSDSSNQTTEGVKTPPQGIGPISKLELSGSIDSSMADKGKQIFEMKCSACHKFEERVVGPALKDITKRRTPEWIMNMILNPVEMTQKDTVAQDLLAEYLTQMTFQNISETEAREILEYFRQIDK
jgi:mono/diheme cytochrome c family protein